MRGEKPDEKEYKSFCYNGGGSFAVSVRMNQGAGCRYDFEKQEVGERDADKGCDGKLL